LRLALVVVVIVRGFPLLMGRESASIAAFASVQFEMRASLGVAIMTPCVSLSTGLVHTLGHSSWCPVRKGTGGMLDES
jgi:hypothetical protein